MIKIVPSEKGIEFYPKLQNILAAANNELTEGLTLEEGEQLIRF
jgi:DNA-binding MarR family transcriptional regulator